MDDQEIKEEESLVDRIKESPRTVSALIIILIVAAAIYAFSGEEGQVAETGEQIEVAQEEVNKEELDEVELTEGDVEEQAQETAAEATEEAVTKVTDNDSQAELAPLPEPQRTENGFVEVAEAGNGRTHLARRASSRWLSENQTGYAVTDEHRIYIEDYIQKKMSTQSLSYGDTMEISFDLIAEAAEAAKGLSENELSNLSQYTYVLQ